jgi:TetR/AcrR family transcriptional regulator, fatty acid metabolism regulator protein
MQSESRPGGRKASFIEEARRAQLIECAIETIADLGFAQASVAQIAKRAGISKSVVTYYFSTKEELIRQVLTQIYTGAAKYIGPKVGAEDTARLRLHAYIRSHVEYISTHLKEMAAVMEIATNHRTEDGKPVMPAAQNPVLTALERMLAKGQESGEFRDFDRGVMALIIRWAIDALPRLLLGDPNAVDPEVYASEVVALFDRATRQEGNE